jgi:hypothetical protein
MQPSGQDSSPGQGARYAASPLRSLIVRKVSRRGVAVRRAEGYSSCARLTPSTGARSSNGILRRNLRPRMHKQGASVGIEARETDQSKEMG